MAIFSEFLNSLFYYFQSAFSLLFCGLKIEYTKGKKRSLVFLAFKCHPFFQGGLSAKPKRSEHKRIEISNTLRVIRTQIAQLSLFLMCLLRVIVNWTLLARRKNSIMKEKLVKEIKNWENWLTHTVTRLSLCWRRTQRIFTNTPA